MVTYLLRNLPYFPNYNNFQLLFLSTLQYLQIGVYVKERVNQWKVGIELKDDLGTCDKGGS